MSVQACCGTKRRTSYAAAGLLALVAAYRMTLALLIGGRCRFTPSCSRYAQLALRRHGARHGVWLVAGRLARCHPWHAGGIDRVPPRLHAAPRAPLQRDFFR